jgi:hypothetical protein
VGHLFDVVMHSSFKGWFFVSIYRDHVERVCRYPEACSFMMRPSLAFCVGVRNALHAIQSWDGAIMVQNKIQYLEFVPAVLSRVFRVCHWLRHGL